MFSTPPDLRRSSPDLRQSSIDLRTDVLYRKNLMEFFFIPEKEIILILSGSRFAQKDNSSEFDGKKFLYRKRKSFLIF